MATGIILDTERTYLRELCEGDYAHLCGILQDAETMYAYEHAFDDDEVRGWLDKQLKRYADDGIGLWAMADRKTGVFIGQVGLTWQDTDRGEELEIGYLLKKSFWHQGYATEGACACREYAFQVLNRERVVSIIRDNNYASRRVAERVGMQKEHTFIKHYYNIDMPHIVYAIHKK